MKVIENVSRRDFLRSFGAMAGLVIGARLMPDNVFAATRVSGNEMQPNVFVSIAPDGTVTVVCHRSEMGQQVRTSMAQIVADELEADWSRVVVAQAEGDSKYGDQNTDGSRSVRRNFTLLRQAGATARTMLEQVAAAWWDVPDHECDAINHEIVHKSSGRKFEFGELTHAAALIAPPPLSALTLKDRENWRYIGKSVPSVDHWDIVRGRGVYGIDIQLDRMKVAVVARPPVLYGKVRSFDDRAALAVRGVEQVIELPALEPPAAFNPLGGVAVIASNTWAAIQGRASLEIEWEHGGNSAYESNAYREQILANSRQSGRIVREDGDVDLALRDAERTISAEYVVPHLAQAPMEPPVATAWVQDGRAQVWASTQTPQSTRREVAAALAFDESQVRVDVPLLGGGFGRKSKPDFSVEAALLARHANAPVKVLWTREDDLRNGYYHTVSAQRIEAALDEDGKTTAWLHRSVFPSIGATFDDKKRSATPTEMRLGFVDNPFDIPNMRLENGEAEAHVRIGWLRSVANVYHAFATQSFAHELAIAAGRDPKDYLLDLIGPPREIDLAAKGVAYDNYGDPIDVYPIDTGRLAHVVRTAAKMAEWGRELPQGRGLGIAAHRSFLSYVATAVEVEVSAAGDLAIPSLWIAIDAGTVVNPDHVIAQCEGGSVYGLSCALLSEITMSQGAVDQANFDNYLVARMNDAPKAINVHIVNSDAPPSGVGEPPTPPLAPALCNAVHAATGKRIRNLPIGDQLRV